MHYNGTVIIIGLAVAWVLQLGLSLWQMRRFYARVRELRQDGRASVGLEGGTYKGRVYTVLVIDDDGVIKHAEKLTGITVFAGLKPVPELTGHHVNSLLDETIEVPIRPKVLASFQKAAEAYFPASEEEQVETEGVAEGSA